MPTNLDAHASRVAAGRVVAVVRPPRHVVRPGAVDVAGEIPTRLLDLRSASIVSKRRSRAALVPVPRVVSVGDDGARAAICGANITCWPSIVPARPGAHRLRELVAPARPPGRAPRSDRVRRGSTPLDVGSRSTCSSRPTTRVSSRISVGEPAEAAACDRCAGVSACSVLADRHPFEVAPASPRRGASNQSPSPSIGRVILSAARPRVVRELAIVPDDDERVLAMDGLRIRDRPCSCA